LGSFRNGEAWSLVFNGDLHADVDHLDVDKYVASLWRVLYSIRQQVHEHLLESNFVAKDVGLLFERMVDL